MPPHQHTCPECRRQWECSGCEAPARLYAGCGCTLEAQLRLAPGDELRLRALGVAA